MVSALGAHSLQAGTPGYRPAGQAQAAEATGVTGMAAGERQGRLSQPPGNS